MKIHPGFYYTVDFSASAVGVDESSSSDELSVKLASSTDLAVGNGSLLASTCSDSVLSLSIPTGRDFFSASLSCFGGSSAMVSGIGAGGSLVSSTSDVSCDSGMSELVGTATSSLAGGVPDVTATFSSPETTCKRSCSGSICHTVEGFEKLKTLDCTASGAGLLAGARRAGPLALPLRASTRGAFSFSGSGSSTTSSFLGPSCNFLLSSDMKPPWRAAILLPAGLDGTAGFGFAAMAGPESDPMDLADEFDTVLVSGTFSDESRVSGFAGRAGMTGFVFNGIGGDEPSDSLDFGRSGIAGWALSVGDWFDGFVLVGRAGTEGINVAAIPVVARPSSLDKGNPAAAFS